MATAVKKNPAADDGNGGNMTLGGHMKELRNRLFVVAGVFAVVTIFTLANAQVFVNALMDIASNATVPYTFVTITPSEMLLQYFRVSLVAAAIVAIPLALFEVWAFANPGLKRSESMFFGGALLFGIFMFVVGAVFAYKITLPFMLNFLITVGQGEVNYSPTISVAEYINFVLTIFIIFGLVFEMPLLSVILSKMGIASPELMKKGRGVAIVIIFVIAAIITPPDIFSQCMVAAPMIVLYQISILLAKVFYKPRLADDDDEDEDDDSDDDEDETAKKADAKKA